MSRFIKIGKAAETLGVSIQTLRRWETLGTISPERRTSGGTRYYDLDKLLGIKNLSNDFTIAYAQQFPLPTRFWTHYREQISRVAPHPGLRPRIRRDPRDLLSVMRPSIGYPAGIAGLCKSF